VFSAAAADPVKLAPAIMPRNTMHHTAVHIPCLMFHTLPTLNRTFILRVSALFALRFLLYSWARLCREDIALCNAFGLKIHCIWGTNIALRFCLV
jgi:uncharacterized membrane protein YeiH